MTARNVFFTNIFGGIFLSYFNQHCFRFHCVDGCWERTQDRCNWCNGSQTL